MEKSAMKIIKKHKEMKEVEIVDEQYDQCDKCGKKINTPCFDAFEFELFVKTGEQFPECGHGSIDTLDLCKECSIKLVSLLRNKGYDVQSKEWDI
jgi:hypothetical protein